MQTEKENKQVSFTFEQLNSPQFRREQQMKIKSEAVWCIFHELNGLINIAQLSREYLHRTQSWFMQKLNNNKVNGVTRQFTEEEYLQISDVLRQIAKRLNDYADELDKAEINKVQ